MLDEEITKWRKRQLGSHRYIILDVTYEKTRVDRSVVSAAVLIAYGVDNKGMRRVLGVSTGQSVADVHKASILASVAKTKKTPVPF